MVRPENSAQEASASVRTQRFAILDTLIEWSVFACAATIILSIAIAQAAALLAFLFWIIKLIAVKGYRFRPSKIQIPFSIFVLARILAIPLSTNPGLSVEAFRTEIFFYGLFYVVLHEFAVTDFRKVTALVWLLFSAGIAAAVYGILMKLLGVVPRAVSTTSGYYTLGMYLCTVLVLVFPLGGRCVIIKPKWVWIAGTVLMLFALLLTYNRLHWAVAGLTMFIAGLLYERKWLLGFGAVGILMVLLLPDVGTRVGMMVNIGSNMSDRDIIWKGATLIWDQHPITGFGLRTFREIFPLFAEVADKKIGSWHNDFLQVYMETGLMGFIPFIAMHASIVMYGIKAVRRLEKGNPYRVVMVSLLFTMMPFILAGFILDTLMHLLFFLIAGVIAAYASLPPEQLAHLHPEPEGRR